MASVPRKLKAKADHLDLVLLSDTHELHREIDVPKGDVLVHAGDLSFESRSLEAICDLDDWLGDLPHRYKIVVPGNHDFFLDSDPGRRSLISNATVLLNQGIEIEGLRIWGSPMTPQLGGAFSICSPEGRKAYWDQVPSTDVLVTHGPPYGVLDRSPGQSERLGDPELSVALARIAPRLHVFGHVHGAHGQMYRGNTLHVNCSILGPEGNPANLPVVVRVPRDQEADV